MNMAKFVHVMALLASMLVLPSFAASKAELEQALSHDGLQKVSVKGLDLAFARPGATLAAYGRVKLEPVEVAFRKDWNPTRTGSSLKLTAEERENIRSGTAKIVYEEFAKALRTKSSYQVVDEIGPDVLRVKINIVNLYVNAPDTLSAGRSRTYTVSAGEMTLFAELFDSETGAIIARVADRREARGTGMMQLSSSVVNAGEAQTIAASWARILRDALDKAHGIGKK
jgi:hypothetical protein